MWILFSAGALTLDRLWKQKARKKELPNLLVPGSSVEFRPTENDGLAGGTFRNHPKAARDTPLKKIIG